MLFPGRDQDPAATAGLRVVITSGVGMGLCLALAGSQGPTSKCQDWRVMKEGHYAFICIPASDLSATCQLSQEN